MKFQIFQTSFSENNHRQFDDQSVSDRFGGSDNLHVEMPEFAIATFLRPVVPEKLTFGKKHHRLRQGLHAIFKISAHNAGGRFRPKSKLVAAASSQAIHFFLHNIGSFADASYENFLMLKPRRDNRRKTVI